MGLSLTFNKQDNYFYLQNAALVPRGVWEKVDALTSRTQSLGAAASYRKYADDPCKKVFDRAFSRSYEMPKRWKTSGLDFHQIGGVKWILTRSRSYLAHAPGAGKTAQAIVAAELAEGTGQTVFIVPPSLTANWEREILKFSTQIYPTIGVVPQSNKKESMAWRADYLIVPDSMLAKPWVYTELSKLKIKLLAVDEASRFKEPTTARAKALYGGTIGDRKYPGLFQKARHTVFLDGSPMPNGRPIELWAPTYALDPLAIDCMNQFEFGHRYCGAQMNRWGQWEFKYSTNEAELREKLQRTFMHVVKEEDLEHPERRRSMLFMNQDVRSPEMKSWEAKHLRSIKFSDLSEDSNQGELASYRKQLGLKKVDWISRYVLDKLQYKNESILLFCWHREVAEQLHQRIAYSELVIGGTPMKAREQVFEKFQSGKCRVIIGNIVAMGRGNNLQRADRVVFGEPSWSDELNKQCEKRASRRGRDKAKFVRCDYIVAPHSIDEPVMNSLFAKQKRTKAVLG